MLESAMYPAEEWNQDQFYLAMNLESYNNDQSSKNMSSHTIVAQPFLK